MSRCAIDLLVKGTNERFIGLLEPPGRLSLVRYQEPYARRADSYSSLWGTISPNGQVKLWDPDDRLFVGFIDGERMEIHDPDGRLLLGSVQRI